MMLLGASEHACRVSNDLIVCHFDRGAVSSGQYRLPPGGAIRYQPISASAAAWRSFMRYVVLLRRRPLKWLKLGTDLISASVAHDNGSGLISIEIAEVFISFKARIVGHYALGFR